MKESIAWHRTCLANATAHYGRVRRDAEACLAACVKGEAQCRHYAAQIAEAERRGMDGFDRERLMKRRTASK